MSDSLDNSKGGAVEGRPHVDLVVITGRTMEVLYMNAAARDFFGVAGSLPFEELAATVALRASIRSSTGTATGSSMRGSFLPFAAASTAARSRTS